MSVFLQRRFLAFSAGFSRRREEEVFKQVFLLTGFLSVCGLVFVAGGLLPDEFAWSASVIIILHGTVTFVSELRARSFARNALIFFVLAGGTFAVEYVGVTTGYPFGAYTYTTTLAPLLFDVPVAIGFAWYATIMNTRRIAEWIHGTVPLLQIAFTASLLTLALDIALEPMASAINRYWLWNDGEVPVQNYMSWFLIGFVCVAAIRATGERIPVARSLPMQIVALTVYALQLVLFVITDLVHGFASAVGFSLLFVAVAIISGYRHRWHPARKSAEEG
ncbi:MAG: carotenoid biosynthesis protein [Bacteroidetes bacterium]|nr:carotenoid biosynthesis protein [Bacteroidota bacterium]MCW5894448.1 carotenoid biosynthesis protein [Bacteroidota bacterium]